MPFVMPNLMPAAPEIFVLCMASLILIADLFVSERNRFLTYLLTQLTLVVAAWITYSTSEPAVAHTFNGLFVDDPLSDILKLMLYAAVFAMLVYSRSYIQLRGMFRG
mgnify:FL=1